MDLTKLGEHSDWVKMWSGKCSINSGTQMGEMWTSDKILIEGKPIYTSPMLFIVRNGVTDCWATQVDRDDLGARLVLGVRADSNKIKEMADSLRANAEKVFSFIKDSEEKKVTLDIYNNFWDILTRYYLPHLSVKYTADYLSPTELEKYLPILQEARVFAEPVFREQEKFVEVIAVQVANESGLTKEQILSLTDQELREYLSDPLKLIEKSILDSRFTETALIFENGNFEVITDPVIVGKVEKIVLPKADQVKGSIAYKGKVIGRVRIVLHPTNYTGVFENGDILVTGMTRPEFLPFLEKAGAFVTDSGGALSHAAISAREMKKPCIVGTANGTKIFKDGDLVEVDADNGIVKVIN